MQFNSSSVLVLNLTAYTRNLARPRSSTPKKLHKVTIVAKQPKPATQQVLKMLTEKCSYLPTKMRGCTMLLQPQLWPDVEMYIF